MFPTSSGQTTTAKECQAVSAPQVLVTIYRAVSKPKAMPVIDPLVVIVAMAMFELSHVPPVAVSDKFAEKPKQLLSRPEMILNAGKESMVTVAVMLPVPHELVMV